MQRAPAPHRPAMLQGLKTGQSGGGGGGWDTDATADERAALIAEELPELRDEAGTDVLDTLDERLDADDGDDPMEPSLSELADDTDEPPERELDLALDRDDLLLAERATHSMHGSSVSWLHVLPPVMQ